MGLLRWIATVLGGLAGRPTAPPAVAEVEAPEPTSTGPGPDGIAMIEATLARTRMGFHSRSCATTWWVAAVVVVLGMAMLVLWLAPPGSPDPPGATVVVLLVVAMVLGRSLGALLVRMTTWRTGDHAAVHVLRQCTWCLRTIGLSFYVSLQVAIVGVGLTVRAYDIPGGGERDFDVLAAVGITVASAGIGSMLVAVGLPFRRSRMLRSKIDHQLGLLRRGIFHPSLDAISDLFGELGRGIGGDGMLAIPVVEPIKCDLALYLYRHLDRTDVIVRVLEEARTRLGWGRRAEPSRRLGRSSRRELERELSRREPGEPPGPVQIAVFRSLLAVTRGPLDDVVPAVMPIWELACQVRTPEQVARCVRELDDLPERIRV